MIRVRAGIGYALARSDGRWPLRAAGRGVNGANRRADRGAAGADRNRPRNGVVSRRIGRGHARWAALPFSSPASIARNAAIAERLRALGAGAPPWPAIDAAKAIPWVEQKTGTHARRKPARGRAAGVVVEGPGDHRRARRRQDHAGATRSCAFSRQSSVRVAAVRAHRPGGEAARRRAPAWRRRPSTACWRPIPKTGEFRRDESIRSTAICW